MNLICFITLVHPKILSNFVLTELFFQITAEISKIKPAPSKSRQVILILFQNIAMF